MLVGTQMVAKGHDFADVTLGVVLDADQTLRFPDFRAEERTFALDHPARRPRGPRWVRVAGRVLVQTMAPTASSIAFAARHDSDGFLAGGARPRRVLGYPPFGSLIRVVCSAAERRSALRSRRALQAGIAPAGATVLGPAPLFRLRGRARSQLVVKCSERRGGDLAVGSAVDECVAGGRRRGVNISVDVDPQ